MNNTLKLEYKVGEIEFKAEGPADIVEQQRVNFLNTVLPAAVEAMVRTQPDSAQNRYVDAASQAPMLETSSQLNTIEELSASENDYARTSLSSFLKQYGILTEQDFVLFSAYFDEMKNGVKSFFIDDVKRYYSEARRSMPKNPSVSLFKLSEKGQIMDAPVPEGAKSGKYYMLTEAGLTYIKEYVPKEKKNHSKPRNTASKPNSSYASLNADDLNLREYPAVKTFSGSKEQVIMTMYIVTKEEKGTWFSIDDIIYLMKNIFEIPANKDMIHGVFRRNPSLFDSKQDINNKKALQYRLLSGAKDFAESVIDKKNEIMHR